MNQKETEKLAEVQRDFIEPAMDVGANVDITIKIRDGRIVFSELDELNKKRIVFAKVELK